MKIRKAKKEDLKAISEIFRTEANKKPYLQKWTRKTALHDITKSFKKEDIYIVFSNKKIAGFIIVSLDDKKEVYIDELWLNSEYQRKGIGRKLMEFIEISYKSKGAKLIKLTANQKTGAVKFYKKLNYKVSNKLLRMTKKLK